MSGPARDGRMHRRVLVAPVARGEGDRMQLKSPSVGYYRGAPTPGTLIAGGALIGELEILGSLFELRAAEGAHGVVVGEQPPVRAARRPVQYGEALLVLDPTLTAASRALESAAHETAGGLVFRSPSSGRFYRRPAPDKPPFVEVGDVIEAGKTVALLEIMKTFHRVAYGGTGLPARARVQRVVPNDGDDLEAGAPLIELEDARPRG